MASRAEVYTSSLKGEEEAVALVRRALDSGVTMLDTANIYGDSEYSLFSREPEEELLPLMRELDIALVAYSPLGRGFLGGRFRSPDDLAPDDWRRSNPRFQGENFARNLALADRVGEIAQEKGCTPSQLALAWLLAQGEDVVPIPGTSNAERLAENIAAAGIQLSATDLRRINETAPRGAAAGRRYSEMGMGLLNR